MRRLHHRLCIQFRPNLASPVAATSDVKIIVFVSDLDHTSLHRELLHEKTTSSTSYVAQTKPHFTGSCYMRRKHHFLCMWFRLNLASPGVVTSDVKSIVFVCGLDQTSLHRGQLYEKKTSSSLYVVQTKPQFTGNCYMRSQHHRLCMWVRPNLASSGAVTADVNIIVFVAQTKPRFTGSSYMRRKHHRL